MVLMSATYLEIAIARRSNEKSRKRPHFVGNSSGDRGLRFGSKALQFHAFREKGSARSGGLGCISAIRLSSLQRCEHQSDPSLADVVCCCGRIAESVMAFSLPMETSDSC